MEVATPSGVTASIETPEVGHRRVTELIPIVRCAQYIQQSKYDRCIAIQSMIGWILILKIIYSITANPGLTLIRICERSSAFIT